MERRTYEHPPLLTMAILFRTDWGISVASIEQAVPVTSTSCMSVSISTGKAFPGQCAGAEGRGEGGGGAGQERIERGGQW